MSPTSDCAQPGIARRFRTEGEALIEATGIPQAPWQNDQERERLLLEQLPNVRCVARRIHERLPRHVPMEDLVHAGVVGLIDALQKYDCNKRVQFGSYAKFRIRGAILDSLREMDWSPRELRRQARQPMKRRTNCARSWAAIRRSRNWPRNSAWICAVCKF